MLLKQAWSWENASEVKRHLPGSEGGCHQGIQCEGPDVSEVWNESCQSNHSSAKNEFQICRKPGQAARRLILLIMFPMDRRASFQCSSGNESGHC